MLLSALALAATLSKPAPYHLGPHFQYWGPNVTQKGVSIGTPRVDEHLILFFPDGTCGRMRVFSGYYGDLDAARKFLWKSKLCQKT